MKKTLSIPKNSDFAKKLDKIKKSKEESLKAIREGQLESLKSQAVKLN